MRYITTALLISMLTLTLLLPDPAAASREMENLGRGVIATYRSYPSPLVYVGWRMLGTEPNDVGYNVYRDNIKLNATPITSSCNFLDNNGSANSTYSVAAVINGAEQERSEPVGTWGSSYLGSGAFMGCQEIPLKARDGYQANDASVGDLDGDGEYELVIKRLYATDNTTAATTTHYHYIEAYEIDGTLLWAINLGPNNIFPVNGVEINPIVYDFDGDGRAEVVLRTTDGAIDGQGKVIGSATADYRSSAVDNSGLMWMTQGDEFISVFDGTTGAEIARSNYIERDPITQWGYDSNLSRNAHRADKCMMTPAYLDGKTPSLVICRGIYEKIAMEAWSFRNGTLSKQWTFSSDNWPGYAQQGNHNMTVGDVDGDGNDEIVYASMCVDDDGSGLYTTGLGHGDALHMSDMIPSRPGLEVFAVHEHDGYGSTLRDAGTGEILWQYEAAGDTGRGCAAHIDSDYPGYQMWSVGTEGKTYDATTKDMVSTSQPNWGNFLIWWDADLQREILDTAGSSGSPIIDKWDSVNNSGYRLISLYNYPSAYASTTINGTKSNPCISGDLFGDWREEAIYPSSDHTKLYIFSTCNMADNRIYTLMHDSQYRTAIAWQCNQYNQPPHPSFYIGAGMDTPPKPDIVLTSGDSTPPDAPTSLSVSAEGARIILDWPDSSEVDLWGYTLYRSTNSGGPYTEIESALTDSTYTDRNIVNGTTYYYVVAANDLYGNQSSYSDEAHAVIGNALVTYLKMEDNVSDDSGNGNDAAATGGPEYATGNIGQAIILDGSDDFLALPADILNTEDLTVAAWIYWNGGSDWQRIFDFGNDTAQYLFLTPCSYDDTLRFAIKNGGNEQVIETSPLPSGEWVHVAVTLNGDTGTLYVNGTAMDSSSSITIDPSDLNPANNYIGKSQWPDPLFDGMIDDFRIYNYAMTTEQIASIIAPPEAPSGLTAEPGDSQITLTWNATDNADGYVVKSWMASGGPYIETGRTTTTNFVHTGRPNGVTIYYVVSATNSIGESENSEEVSAAATAVAAPSAPTGLTCESGDAQVLLHWNATENADSYSVKFRVQGDSTYQIAGSPTATNITHSGLSNGTNYYYVVSAVSAGGESENSEEVHAIPSAAVSSAEYLFSTYSIAGGTNLSLIVSNSVLGHIYQLLSTDSLLDLDWQEYGSPTTGDGAALLFDIPLADEASNQYFKLDVLRQ